MQRHEPEWYLGREVDVRTYERIIDIEAKHIANLLNLMQVSCVCPVYCTCVALERFERARCRDKNHISIKANHRNVLDLRRNN